MALLLQESSASSKKSEFTFNDHNDSDSFEEEPTMLPIVGISKKKATKAKEFGKKSVTLDSSDESEDGNDLTLPKKKLISPPQSAESSVEPSEGSDSELVMTNDWFGADTSIRT